MTVPGATEIPGIQAALARVQEIHAQAGVATGQATPAVQGQAQGQGQAFGQALDSARAALLGQIGAVTPQASTALPTATLPGTPVGALATQAQLMPAGTGAPYGAQPGSTGQRLAAIATAELGVQESPPGSNEGARIAEYRTATQGSVGGEPWCAYFASWVARQAGVPVGDRGEGMGYVPDIQAWANRTNRWVPAQGGTPVPGDLVIFDRNGDGTTDHIGVVTGVRADGGFSTVEGNSGDAVSARSYGAGEATGFVRLAPPGV